jgi:hypothetical protein
VPVIIDKIEVFVDFHIYAILEFDILIGYPLKNLIQEKPSHGGLDDKLGKTAFVIHLETPMAEHLPNHYPFEEAKFIFPFISPKLACETEHTPSPSLEPKSCPSGHLNVVLDSDRESTLILHDRFCAMDMPKAPTLETEKNDFTVEHEGFSFETPHVSSSRMESLEIVVLSATYCNEEDNLPSLLISKLFRRMVLDVFVYHKYCKSRSSTVVLTLQPRH